MRVCKLCGKPIPVKNYGLRNFCSTACKIAYRKEYLRQKKQQYKQGNNKGSCVNTYSNTGTIPDGFYEAIDTKTTRNEIISSRNTFTFYEATDTKTTLNPEDLRIAKECCNYEMKQVVEYCITLHEPYYAFKTECKDCFIFHCLKQALSRSKNGRITTRAC